MTRDELLALLLVERYKPLPIPKEYQPVTRREAEANLERLEDSIMKATRAARDT